MNGQEAMARLLLENRADIEEQDYFEETALHWAACRGHEGMVRLLLEKGADIRAQTS
jgi:ankyrin repeat protein